MAFFPIFLSISPNLKIELKKKKEGIHEVINFQRHQCCKDKPIILQVCLV